MKLIKSNKYCALRKKINIFFIFDSLKSYYKLNHIKNEI